VSALQHIDREYDRLDAELSQTLASGNADGAAAILLRMTRLLRDASIVGEKTSEDADKRELAERLAAAYAAAIGQAQGAVAESGED
jgi:hypothetical protein